MQSCTGETFTLVRRGMVHCALRIEKEIGQIRSGTLDGRNSPDRVPSGQSTLDRISSHIH